MRRYRFTQTILAVAVLTLLSSYAHAEEFFARFSGFNEIGGLGAGETGAILYNGKGTLQLDLDRDAGTLTYTLTYSDLSAPVTQAHIHFGKVHVAGGVIVFLCSNIAAPAGTPACPAGGGTVSGTITAANVIGPAPQGVAAGNFDGLEDALTSNTAYGNIHTTNFPAGEIRGQIRRPKGDKDHHEGDRDRHDEGDKD